jgi:hypothetical protein
MPIAKNLDPTAFGHQLTPLRRHGAEDHDFDHQRVHCWSDPRIKTAFRRVFEQPFLPAGVNAAALTELQLSSAGCFTAA